MSGLPRDTWARLLIWLVIGLVIYFGYSQRHSRLHHGLFAKANPPDEKPPIQ